MSILDVRTNKFGIGLDVGWLVQCTDGQLFLKWGNIRDAATLPALIEDLKARGREVELSETARKLLEEAR